MKKIEYPSDFVNKFTCGKTIEVMKQIPDGSVDLIVTSPPYNIRNSVGNGFTYYKTTKNPMKIAKGYSHYDDNIPHEEYVKWQKECLTEMMRIIPDDGAIFYNHKWRVQNGLIQDRKDIVSDFPVRQIIIWDRGKGMNFNDGYFVPTYEVIYLITKPKFKLAKKACAIGDVWHISQEQKNKKHPAPFPVELADRIIKSTNAKIVLDPFMGSGSTAMACKALGRDFIGIDLSPDYCQMATDRLRSLDDFC